MTQPAKEVPQAEVSLKYMAWNVKQMDANLKRVADSVAELVEMMKHRGAMPVSKMKQEEIPF